jgi:hypothetical protein
MNSIETLSKQKNELLNNWPNLKSFSVIDFQASGKTIHELSVFIEDCFEYSFPTNTRMKFTSNFINRNFQDASALLVQDPNDRIIASYLNFPGSYTYDNHTGKYALSTGWAVKPEYQNAKIGQLLHIENKISLIQQGYDFSILWIDARHTYKGTSFKIMKKEGWLHEMTAMPLYCKSYNLERVSRYEHLNVVLKISIRLFQKLYPSEVPTRTPFFTNRFDSGKVTNYLAFINQNDTLEPVRQFGRKELFNLYHSNDMEAFFYTLFDENEEIRALAFGFLSPQRHGDTIAFFDGIILSPSLARRRKAQFIGMVENSLISEHDTMAGIIPSTCRKNSIFYGYIPYEKQMLVVDFYKDLNFTAKDITNLLIGLR